MSKQIDALTERIKALAPLEAKAPRRIRRIHNRAAVIDRMHAQMDEARQSYGEKSQAFAERKKMLADRIAEIIPFIEAVEALRPSVKPPAKRKRKAVLREQPGA